MKKFFCGLFFLATLVTGLINGARTAEACDDKGKIYSFCADQKKLYEASAAKAAAEKKPLVLVFGAEWCPWCVSLDKLLKKDGSSPYVIQDVAMYREREKIPSGYALLDEVAGWSKSKVDKKGIPLLAVIDPAKKSAVFIPTEPLEKNTATTKGHDETKVSSAIKQAIATL